jgi:hypothetical protein
MKASPLRTRLICGGLTPLEQPVTGKWPFKGFPAVVQLLGRRFTRTSWEWPYPGVAAQYREDVPAHSLHILVRNDGTWSADHVDEANPDHGFVLQHAAVDLPPVGKLAVFLGLLLTMRWLDR